MSGYTGQDNYWSPPPQQNQFNNEPVGFGQPNQQFDFHNYTNDQNNDYSGYSQQPYLDPTQNSYAGNITYAAADFENGMWWFIIFINQTKKKKNKQVSFFWRFACHPVKSKHHLNKNNIINFLVPEFGSEEDEPPLLEELGIDPDRIIQKTLAVLNPFHRRGQIDDANYLMQDTDLAGPGVFCLVLAGFLLLSGSKAHFGYIYGLAMTSCFLMYLLQSLMSSTGNITIFSVASVLGYCLLPVVALAGLGIFTTLKGPIGMILAAMAVLWATLSASRLFSALSGEEKQKILIAYPCFLLYGVFTLIVIF